MPRDQAEVAIPADAALAEINGFGANGRAISANTDLADDASTRCGCWIYAGVYADGVNQADGPLPAYYEPPESPVDNRVHPGQQRNPARELVKVRGNLTNPSGSEPGGQVFPYVFTTYRLTEHHTAGGMSRTLPFLTELQPDLFIEVGPGLADERGLEHMGWATVVTGVVRDRGEGARHRADAPYVEDYRRRAGMVEDPHGVEAPQAQGDPT